MSLEARIELLTAAVIELTAAIGAGVVGSLEKKADEANRRANPKGAEHESMEARAASQEQSRTAAALAAAKKEAEQKSTDTTSGKPSAPTGESSSPELDYAKDVKPITLRLSKEKGREVTIAVLQRFGVKGAQELDKAQWADYIAHCGKVLAGGEV